MAAQKMWFKTLKEARTAYNERKNGFDCDGITDRNKDGTRASISSGLISSL